MASHTKKRGGACSGHRLGRVPSGDTLLVSAPFCGRCLLMEANLCADCDGLDAERIDLRMPDSPGGVKGLALSLLRRTMECRLGELSYVHGASETPLLGETIFQNLRRTAERHGDREALVVAHQGHRSTYRELVAECELVGRGLLARGVRRGDRVGIWSPNRYEWVITQYATAAIGAILVNINPAYRTSELEYVLNQSGISFLILAAGFRQADYRAMLAEVKGRCAELREALVLEDGWEALQRDGARTSLATLRELEASLQFDDPINIQYTSGTTGFPKGATLTHHHILNNGFFIGETLRYSENDRVCIPVPFYHCFGMVLGNLACTTHGATMVIPAEAYDPVATMQTVQQERCTALYGVPTMFIGELEHPRFKEFDFSSLRTGIMAGSPCPVEVMKKVQTVMHIPEMTIAYGMTETSPVSTQCATDDPLEKRVWNVGRAVQSRLHGHARLLEQRAGDAPGYRWRPLDAHGRPRHDGRARLRKHRRPHQGHDHPRRREHLSA